MWHKTRTLPWSMRLLCNPHLHFMAPAPPTPPQESWPCYCHQFPQVTPGSEPLASELLPFLSCPSCHRLHAETLLDSTPGLQSHLHTSFLFSQRLALACASLPGSCSVSYIRLPLLQGLLKHSCYSHQSVHSVGIGYIDTLTECLTKHYAREPWSYVDVGHWNHPALATPQADQQPEAHL